MFGFVRRDGLVQTDVVARRSRYRINRDPYPGNYPQILQDFARPCTSEYWDAPRFGASFGLRVCRGLAALEERKKATPFFGFNRTLVDVCLPG